MDKGLQKITKLKEKIEILLNEVNEIDIIKEQKTKENYETDKTICNLLNKKSRINEVKSNINYKQKNIKKYKAHFIAYVIGCLLFHGACVVMLNSMIASYHLLGTVLFSASIVPLYIGLVKESNYIRSRQYLKQHKIDFVEKQINEIDQELSLNKEKRDNNSSEITKLTNNKKEIQNEITSLEQEIENIQNMRKTIITKFLESDKDLEAFLDIAYVAFEEQKNKTKAKK